MYILIFQFFCIVIAVFTMQCYVYRGAYSKAHRLLPVFLACLIVYYFYEIGLTLTGAADVFQLLERLLLVQVTYLVVHYIFDFNHERIPLYIEVIGFVSLMIGNIVIILDYLYDNSIFFILYMIFAHVYGIFAIVMAAVFFIKHRLTSKRERYVAGMLYLSILVPTFAVPFQFSVKNGHTILSLCLLFSCIIILILLRKDYLISMSQELQNTLFFNNNIATILYDSDKQFLKANDIAESCFPWGFLQDISNFPTDEDHNIFQFKDSFYRCHLTSVPIGNKSTGTILTALDISAEQKSIHSISITSHKMRTPLNVILGMSQYLLSSTDLSDESCDAVEKIQTSGKTLLSFVNEILYTSGISMEDATDETVLNSPNPIINKYDTIVTPTYIYPSARVLVAEDMIANQDVFKKLVSPWEFTLDFVENGQQAIDAVRKNTYQLVFLDKMMPVLNGLEAASEIKKFSDVPLIIFTADVSNNICSQYKAYGFDAFLAKPFSMSDLKNIIETLMPFDYQEFPDDDDDDIFIPEDNQNAVLLTYCDEVASLSSSLKDLMNDDISLFRTKVHGIKSSSKQLGYLDLGEEAEILEMAAKLENMSFIKEHIDAFVTNCSITINQIRERM